MACCFTCLGDEEQLVMESCTGEFSVENGPGCTWYAPWTSTHKRSVLLIPAGTAIAILDKSTATERVVAGPCREWMGEREERTRAMTCPQLAQSQYMVVRDRSTGKTENVVGPMVYVPGPHESCGTPEQCPQLTHEQYVVVTDSRTGTMKTVMGPQIYAPGKYDQVSNVKKCSALSQQEYIIVTDTNSGEMRNVVGPTLYQPGPYDSVSKKQSVYNLSRNEYIYIQDGEGCMKMVRGEARVIPDPLENVLGGVRKAVNLSKNEYIYVQDEEGRIRVVQGEALVIPSPLEQVIGQVRTALNLAKNEYVRIKDEEGVMRVERGEGRIIPGPYDEVIGGVHSAVNIDHHTAVLVRNEDTGSLILHTEHGLFFPTAYQQIVRTEKKIILEEYQSMVYKDKTGKFHYVRGDGDMRDFFLPPFCEVVSQEWSTDLRKEHTSVEKVWKFDRRPSYMNYEFNCRTMDNVELIVDVSFFWGIIDVQLLVEKTADAPGDTCTHARSSIIQQVSKIQLMDFLENFNSIIREACVGDEFYQERGVDLISVEVLKFQCASGETDMILQDIIKETADRLKKKERQKGENDVALSRLGGEIEEERMKKELIELQKSHLVTGARIEGDAEASQLTAFLERATKELSREQAMTMYMALHNSKAQIESVRALSQGATQMYLTPNDVTKISMQPLSK